MNFFNKLMVISLSLLSLTLLTGCASTNANYVSINKIEAMPKQSNAIEHFVIHPKRMTFHLGNIGVDGNGFSNHEDIIKAAKKKAAEVGADFIVREDAGTETKTVVNPGYSSYQSNGSAFVSGNQYSAYGSANQQATGYSVGPSITTYNFPWGVFSAWVYRPSKSGINLGYDNIVTGFHLNCDAEAAGMRVGDIVVGIDGFDINDNALVQHLMNIKPGDQCTYTVSQNGKRKDFVITTLPN